eukprot:1769458-Amphidinium_carterae.2
MSNAAWWSFKCLSMGLHAMSVLYLGVVMMVGHSQATSKSNTAKEAGSSMVASCSPTPSNPSREANVTVVRQKRNAECKCALEASSDETHKRRRHKQLPNTCRERNCCKMLRSPCNRLTAPRTRWTLEIRTHDA